MERREFIKLLGGAAWSWPVACYAQQGKSAALKRIGVLNFAACPISPDSAIRRRLAELGWVDGRTFVYDCVSTVGRFDQVPIDEIDQGFDTAPGIPKTPARPLLSRGERITSPRSLSTGTKRNKSRSTEGGAAPSSDIPSGRSRGTEPRSFGNPEHRRILEWVRIKESRRGKGHAYFIILIDHSENLIAEVCSTKHW
jgi:hypothetical protein